MPASLPRAWRRWDGDHTYMSYVQYTGSNGRSTTQFANIIPPESVDGRGITEAIEKGLVNVNVGEDVLREKLVACNFDGASVMIGCKSGESQVRE